MVNLDGVDDGVRTHDNRDHNPGLYQLSYNHHNMMSSIFALALQNGAPGGTRTHDHPLRRRVLYPAELQARSRQHRYSTITAKLLVGVQGFEPWTPCSQSRCATRLRHTPILTVLSITHCVSMSGILGTNTPLVNSRVTDFTGFSI